VRSWLSLFLVRQDELTDELTITTLSKTISGVAVTGGQARTTGGIRSARHPAGRHGNCSSIRTRSVTGKSDSKTTNWSGHRSETA
jgi:hypothetical protein